MDREGFRNRLKQYKQAREENPGLKYWEWKNIPKYDEGTEYVERYSTEENPILYKEESAKDRYVRAVNELKQIGGWSDNLRTELANQYSIPYLPEKEIRLTTGRYNTGKISTNLLDSIYASAVRTGTPVDVALGLAGRESTLGIGRGFKKGQSINGTNLMSNWQQIDPDIPTSKDRDKFNDIRAKILFHDDVSDEEYNFSADYIFNDIESRQRLKPLKENPIDNALKFYQSGRYNPGDKKHSKMVEEDAKILMSDPAIKKWAQEKGIAFAEGTDGVLESYYNPTTVEGVLAKTALQLADPTGVSSYPDVWYSGKEFLKSPSWAKLGDVGLNTLSALPLIGKVTAPFKAAKMAKLLTRIEDANALVKGVEKANRLNRVIDTVPELLPVVRIGAEKVQDVTSALMTNPIFNYVSNQNKFDLVRNYRNINAAVDAVNIGNNTADLTQGIGTLLGYNEGGEVTGPPTESEWKRNSIKDALWMHPDFYMAHSLAASKEALKQASSKLPGRDQIQVEELPVQRPITGDFPYGWAIENLYDVENPYRKGIKNGVAKMYDDRTLGAGVDVKSGHPELYDRAKKHGLKLKEADNVAYNHIQHDADVIRDNYAYIYGKEAADTLSLGPLFLLAQARYQQGNIKRAWDLAQKGLAEGDAEKIIKATLSVTPKDHTYRRNWVKNFKVYDNNPK